MIFFTEGAIFSKASLVLYTIPGENLRSGCPGFPCSRPPESLRAKTPVRRIKAVLTGFFVSATRLPEARTKSSFWTARTLCQKELGLPRYQSPFLCTNLIIFFFSLLLASCSLLPLTTTTPNFLSSSSSTLSASTSISTVRSPSREIQRKSIEAPPSQCQLPMPVLSLRCRAAYANRTSRTFPAQALETFPNCSCFALPQFLFTRQKNSWLPSRSSSHQSAAPGGGSCLLACFCFVLIFCLFMSPPPFAFQFFHSPPLLLKLGASLLSDENFSR
mmetsp:Transcript_88346/g.175667  ORF Transcript_88346/g.175667 Transcript_88346/m.175667 type:complete len:274 (+) Transcript_88346:205-1026(+)